MSKERQEKALKRQINDLLKGIDDLRNNERRVLFYKAIRKE